MQRQQAQQAQQQQAVRRQAVQRQAQQQAAQRQAQQRYPQRPAMLFQHSAGMIQNSALWSPSPFEPLVLPAGPDPAYRSGGPHSPRGQAAIPAPARAQLARSNFQAQDYPAGFPDQHHWEHLFLPAPVPVQRHLRFLAPFLLAGSVLQLHRFFSVPVLGFLGAL